MFGLSILNPILWFGAFALAIPLAIHLMTRRTPVDIVFPTLQFLTRAKANQSRLYRIRHILLMLLRTAAILLVLLAFLRPVYQVGALSRESSSAGQNAVVVIVDTSLSMGYSGSAITPLSRAKAATESILEHLSGGDIANLIIADVTPRMVLDEPSTSRLQLRRDIQTIEAGLGRSDMDAAIALAVSQLELLSDYDKEIHLVSDFQRTNWASVNFPAIPEDVKTIFVSLSDESKTNVAITDVSVLPNVPAVGEDVVITCKIANYSEALREIPLTLQLTGSDNFERRVKVQPGATSMATFRLRMHTSGIYEGTLKIPADGLAADDERRFSMRVRDQFPVTILSDRPLDTLDAAHRFVAASLDPSGDGSSIFVPNVIKSDAFDKYIAGRSHVVVLSELSALSEQTARALVSYLREGGSVVYFLSGRVDKGNLDLLTEVSEGDLELPFSVGAYVDVSDDSDIEYAALHEANYEHAMLKKFRETGSLADLNFFRFFTTTRNEAQGQVLLRYDNSHIALAEKSLGRGTLLLANFTPDLDSGNLVKHTVYVPFMHEMVRALRSGSDSVRAFAVGYPCSTSVLLPKADAQLRFVAPGKKEVSATVDINGLEGSVIFPTTGDTGFYRVYGDDDLVGSVPVNVDSRESNLASLDFDQLEELAQRARDQFYAESGGDAEALRRLREGQPLWYMFLLAALGLLALEQTLTMVWKS